jgi:hypothetical protein
MIRRQKTQAVFHVPIYAHLLPLLERLRREVGEHQDLMPEGEVHIT